MPNIKSLTLSLRTSTAPSAGTNASVWLDLGGIAFELAATGRNPFEVGQTDAFILPIPAPGIPRSQVWRVMLCTAPGPDDWRVAAIRLVDDGGRVLYARDGLDAHLNASTERQWRATDLTGVRPPPMFSLPADALRYLLEGPLHEALHGNFGELKDAKPKGSLALQIECDGMRLSQKLEGRMADANVEIAVSLRMRPFITTIGDERTLDLAIGQVEVDVKLPMALHVFSLGASAIAEVAIEKLLRDLVRNKVKELATAKLTAVGVDLASTERLALRPGAMDIIGERPPIPRLRHPIMPWL